MSESFDRALRAAARRGREAGVCPDAATLAAYADNGLSAAERARLDAHAADCATCLQHLALLGAVSVERGEPAEPARSWLGRWGWLVPVATALLVVAVWVRMPERNAAVEVEGDEVARVAPREQARLEDDARAPAAPPARFEPAPGAASPASQPPSGAAQAGKLARSNEARQKAAAPAAPPAPAAGGFAAPPAPAASAQGASRRDQPLLGQAAPAPAGVAASEQAAPAPATEAVAAADALKEEVRVAPSRDAALRKSVTASPAPLLARASATEWYRVTGRRIERSADGGTTWRDVLTDARAPITAVACAPAGPCWFGSADGEVLRPTPDGFARGSLPVRLPVAAIVPGGGSVAVVSVQDGRRYRTTDGGATWTQVP
jgi:hypothetical protein